MGLKSGSLRFLRNQRTPGRSTSRNRITKEAKQKTQTMPDGTQHIGHCNQFKKDNKIICFYQYGISVVKPEPVAPKLFSVEPELNLAFLTPTTRFRNRNSAFSPFCIVFNVKHIYSFTTFTIANLKISESQNVKKLNCQICCLNFLKVGNLKFPKRQNVNKFNFV